MTLPCLILVSPKGESNLGGVARVMGNFGLKELRVVEPRCELLTDEVKKMALQAFPIVERARIFPSLEEALSDLHWAMALSMRSASSESPQKSLWDLRKTDFPDSQSMGIVLGREDSGLTNEELRLVDLQIHIPTCAEMPSMNLVSATALSLGWWSQITSCPSSNSQARLRPKKEDEQIFFRALDAMLRDIGFLKSNSPTHILEDLQDMYHRSEMGERDLRILFGILSDLGRHHQKNYF